MTRLVRTALAAAVITTATTAPAHADVELGLFTGAHIFSHNGALGTTDITAPQSLRNSVVAGLRLGVMFTPMLGVEAEGGIIPTEPRNLVFSVYGATFRGQLIAQFRGGNPDSKILPFVLAGAGVTNIVKSSNLEVVAEDSTFAPYLGLGAKVRLPGTFALRFEARAFLPGARPDKSAIDGEVLVSIYRAFGKKAAPKDTDHDGIVDSLDKCPTEPEDKDGFQDDDGCPDPDNDGDGVPDAQDQCPTEAETKNGYQDEDGCPDEVPAKLKAFTGTIQGITFQPGAATLQATSFATLDKAVAVLKEFDALKLEIQGHTDDQPLTPGGKFADNTALSQARAETVRDYFVKKGIAADRLIAKGYGEAQPIEAPAGKTGVALAALRAKNRRVEFKLVSSLTAPSP
ncbi:MAG: OmpA family protein [Deltaproteobacteria bacterium]|nr:OmpA family protein [Deltaproteobacteria bacterium]